MIKINSRITVITVFSSIIIMLLVGITSIITSMYVINKEATANLMLLAQNKVYILEDTFRKIEISTEDLADYVETTFSIETLNKYGINYLKDYTESMIPLVKNFTVNTGKVKACYLNFDPEIVKSNKMYEVWVYDKTESGKSFDVITTEPKSTLYPVDKPELDWFYKPKVTGKPTWSDSFTEEIVYASMISYTKPVYVQGKFIGVAGMDISVEKLKNIILDLKVYETGYAFLLDKNFDMVIHKKYKINEKLEKINNSLFKSLKKQSAKHKTGIINYHHDNIDKVACYKKLNNGLIFAITVPKAEILRQKFNLQILITSITLLNIILAVLIMINKE